MDSHGGHECLPNKVKRFIPFYENNNVCDATSTIIIVVKIFGLKHLEFECIQ